ncbi:translation initiation factor IF-2-like [Vespa velutina]|uniref:translation initiation factor IF-2-like n=1 Tax=Vespa velutina TaxID=202808 RepID=UPI001FB1E743|nr:translation initiation factor IF-2-like [Vespa velutina]
MAPRRNAKQADVEPVEKVAEIGDVSPPKRTKVIKSLSVNFEQLKDTRSMRSTKIRNVEETGEIIEPESEPVKKSRARNKVVPAKSTKVTSSQEQITKSKRIVKKGKAIEDISSSNGPNDPIIETDDSISQKIPAKKTRGKTVTEKAGTTDNIEAKAKPKTRAKKTETSKDTDTEIVSTKEKKKNVAEKVSKETKTKVKPLKKVVEKKDETVVVEVKKKTSAKAKTTENNISKVEKSAVNEEKKPKSQVTRKMRNQADNVPDATENNVEETNDSKPVKGRQRKINKDNASTIDTSKKGRGKKEIITAAVKNLEEKELETAELSSSEEEKESESIEVLSKTNNVQKSVSNTDELPNVENEDLTKLDALRLNKNNKNKIEDSISDEKDNASTSE